MSPTEPVVVTGRGALRGTREGRISTFRGVPFAAPPTGALRLRPPAFHGGWSGVRDATRMGPAPPQDVDPLSQMLGLDFEGETAEDALQLNVWTPAADDGRRPVLVWLHGGAFATGSGTSPAYCGQRLAERGDVVVVTLNYRVGALGFLHLGGETSNLGLQDQVMALRFVQREIAHFGGDPDCVTVFGESAGAGSLVALLAMPSARGLFRRAIVQSAAPDGMLLAPEGEERARRLASELGVPARADALREVPLERILAAQAACIAAGPHRTGMFFAPVIDGEILPTRPLDAIARGDARDVELLIGTTEEEMQLYAMIPGMGDFPDEVLTKIVASRLEGSEEARDCRAQAAIQLYREELGTPSQRDLFFALETDLSLRVPSTRLAGSQAGFQPRTFMYLFQWRSPMPDGQGGALGACHALDLPFTFGSLDRKAARSFATGDRADLLAPAEALSGHIMDAWIAFARSGDPSHAAIGEWPAYDEGRRATMLLGKQCRTALGPLEARRAVWDD